MKCRGCGKQFKAQKVFHRYCNNCVRDLRKCGVCGKSVFPKNEEYNCCGHRESKEYVHEAECQKRYASKEMARAILSGLFSIAPEGVLDVGIHGPNGEYYSSQDEFDE